MVYTCHTDTGEKPTLPKAHELQVSVLWFTAWKGRLWDSPCLSHRACWLCERRWQHQDTALAGISAGNSGDGAVAVKQSSPNSWPNCCVLPLADLEAGSSVTFVKPAVWCLPCSLSQCGQFLFVPDVGSLELQGKERHGSFPWSPWVKLEPNVPVCFLLLSFMTKTRDQICACSKVE